LEKWGEPKISFEIPPQSQKGRGSPIPLRKKGGPRKGGGRREKPVKGLVGKVVQEW